MKYHAAGVLDHVKRILVAHVDDGCADLDPAGLGADRREQRERRAELAREVMDAKIGAIRAQFLGRDRKIDGLQQRIRSGGSAIAAKGSSVRREKANLFHGGQLRA